MWLICHGCTGWPTRRTGPTSGQEDEACDGGGEEGEGRSSGRVLVRPHSPLHFRASRLQFPNPNLDRMLVQMRYVTRHIWFIGLLTNHTRVHARLPGAVLFPLDFPSFMRIFSLLCCLRSPHHESNDSTNGGAAKSAKTAAGKAPAKLEPYSEQRARELFKTYEDPDSPGEIGPEGFEKLCTDLEISLEGALPLVLAWQMHATEMAKFKESEWMQGTGELRYVLQSSNALKLYLSPMYGNSSSLSRMRSASSLQALALVLHDLEDLLLLDKPPIQPSGSAPKKKGVAASDTSEPYSRAKYYQYAADKNKGFRELYNFCFALAKPPYVSYTFVWVSLLMPFITEQAETLTWRCVKAVPVISPPV